MPVRAPNPVRILLAWLNARPDEDALLTPRVVSPRCGVSTASESPVSDAEVAPHGIADAEVAPHGIANAEVAPHGIANAPTTLLLGLAPASLSDPPCTGA